MCMCLCGSLARVVSGPLPFLAGSTRVACFFSIVFFECVGFSCVVLDVVCSAILPSDWLAEPCPYDAYVEELSVQRPVASGPVNL